MTPETHRAGRPLLAEGQVFCWDAADVSMGTTPLRIPRPSAQSVLELRLEGYEPAEVSVGQRTEVATARLETVRDLAQGARRSIASSRSRRTRMDIAERHPAATVTSEDDETPSSVAERASHPGSEDVALGESADSRGAARSHTSEVFLNPWS